MVKGASSAGLEIIPVKVGKKSGKMGLEMIPLRPDQVQSAPLPQRKKASKKLKNSSVMPAVGPLASRGGQLQEVQAHANKVSGFMQSNKPISTEGKSSIMTILNPCGELGSDENAKFPDGTLSQSGVQRFRQFETIVAPWQTFSSSANVTNNWSLYIISPASFRTVAVLIAVRDGKALTDTEFAMVFTSMNVDAPMVDYPNWNSIGIPGTGVEPNVYYTTYSFKAAHLDLDPGTGESKSIESFRVVGDGMVVMHNTPDLWNQGSFAVGQFKTDFAMIETDTTATPVVIEVLTSAVGTTLEGSVSMYAVINGVKTIILDGVLTGAGPWTFNTVGGAYTLKMPSPDNEVFYTTTSGGDPIGFVYTPGPNPTLTISNTSVFPSISMGLFTGTGTFVFMLQGEGPTLAMSQFNPSQLVLSLPSLNQDSIVQADPKFSAELMKAHCGFYAVRRYFEPKLNMNNSNVSGNIKLEVQSMSKEIVVDAPGGIVGDILDRNGSTIIAAIRGISYACSPTIKSVRYVEFLPAPDSPLAPFVGPTPPKDDDAEEIFRQVQLSGPHSYVPDANLLGGLATFIMSVVDAVPVFLRTARGISNAVSNALSWVESKIPVM
jgi:hypothetical protein